MNDRLAALQALLAALPDEFSGAFDPERVPAAERALADSSAASIWRAVEDLRDAIEHESDSEAKQSPLPSERGPGQVGAEVPPSAAQQIIERAAPAILAAIPGSDALIDLGATRDRTASGVFWWLLSRTTYLGGAMPIEVWASDPETVLDVARRSWGIEW